MRLWYVRDALDPASQEEELRRDERSLRATRARLNATKKPRQRARLLAEKRELEKRVVARRMKIPAVDSLHRCLAHASIRLRVLVTHKQSNSGARAEDLSGLERAATMLKESIQCVTFSTLATCPGLDDALQPLPSQLDALLLAVSEARQTPKHRGGAPQRWELYWTATLVAFILEACGIRPTTTKDGRFWKALRAVIKGAEVAAPNDMRPYVKTAVRDVKLVRQGKKPH